MSGHISEKDSTWLLPDCKNQHLPPGLYLVATPIGNLGDITVRALEVLSRADVVVCEDKRVTGKLLKGYELSKPLAVYNDHSQKEDRDKILQYIGNGQIVALVSDAGMPMISDPGYKLVQDCLENGVHVSSLPGANAPLMALQLSGLPSDKFTFVGFLPSKTKARKEALDEWRDRSPTLVMFESAKRLLKTLADIHDILGDRQMAVVRELTKLHEDVRRGSVQDLMDYYGSDGAPRGEIVLVVEGKTGFGMFDEEVLKQELIVALKSMKTKDASRFVSEKFGVSSKYVYAMALMLRHDQVMGTED